MKSWFLTISKLFYIFNKLFYVIVHLYSKNHKNKIYYLYFFILLNIKFHTDWGLFWFWLFFIILCFCFLGSFAFFCFRHGSFLRFIFNYYRFFFFSFLNFIKKNLCLLLTYIGFVITNIILPSCFSVSSPSFFSSSLKSSLILAIIIGMHQRVTTSKKFVKKDLMT